MKPEKLQSKQMKGSVKKTETKTKSKRPLSSYMLFFADFRKTYKEENPDSKGVAEVAKACGAAWREISAEDKKKYTEKAEELKKATLEE